MKTRLIFLIGLLAIGACTTSCYRRVQTAIDITPENNFCSVLDGRYGMGDIRIQTTKLTTLLMDRWVERTSYDFNCGKPRIIITDIDNCTNEYISTEMIRDVLESEAIEDGRFTVLVGNRCDEMALDNKMGNILNHPKYSNSSRLNPGQAIAPQFMAKVRLTSASSSDRRYVYVDYRMTVTLYDIETQEAIDSAWDTLTKRINAY